MDVRSELGFKNTSKHTSFFSEAACHENVFSQTDLNDICEFMFRSTSSWRLSETGNLFFAGKLKAIVSKYYSQINSIVDLSEVTAVRGNFFHTPHQYGFHTDMPERTDKDYISGDVAYKTVLIPLYKLPSNAECHILFFKERLLAHGATLDRGPSKSQTHYNSYSEYEEIKGLYDVDKQYITYKRKPFDQIVFDKYNLGQTSPIERFEGFNVESVFNWEPGSAIVFDTAQLHLSNKGVGNKLFKTKAGLRLSLWRNYLGGPVLHLEK